MTLATYKKKRDFGKTPEPAGRERKQTAHALHYVIQKHDASRLHYDFRLEFDGVLKSWAVPKGPSLDPARKALAVQVEDHPLDYESFEGIIPEGQYGGGTVMLWDRGIWEPLDDPRAGLEAGTLHFTLHGEKLRGAWRLVRMHGSAGEQGKNWLLIKSQDEYANTTDILTEAPTSVSTHRTMEEIAGEKDAVWDSRHGRVPVNKDASHNGHAHRNGHAHGNGQAPRKKRASVNGKGSLRGKPAHVDPMPDKIAPQLATLAQHPPEGEQWVHEIKFDGYRLVAFINNGDVHLHTRTSQDWTHRFQPLVPALEKLDAQSAILDGEVVVLNPEGRSDFELLQMSFKAKSPVNLRYFVFDLLYLDGQDLRQLPLLERKARLRDLLAKSGTLAGIEYSDHVQGSGEEVIRKACALGSEGIISKRADAPYVSRRDTSWLKSKCVKGQEFVIIGYTISDKRKGDLRSILLGYYDAEKGLVYCGRAGTGFDEKMRSGLLEKFKGLSRDDPATDTPPPRREQAHAHWLKPELVCEAHFEGWTRDGVLRHPVFIALRLDKPAREVTREVPVLADKKKRSTAEAETPTAPAENGAQQKSKTKTTPHRPVAAAPGQAMWSGVKLTHPERVLYPESGLQKQDLARYYEIAAPFMLPHVAERPLALKRCPDGLASACFFARNWSTTMPPAVDKVPVNLGKHESHVMIHDLAGLLSLVQISALEIHTWNCRREDMEHPDQVVFDLDPGPDVPWKKIIAAAHTLRELLRGLGLTPFLKTSGGKGFHLTVPIAQTVDWKSAKLFCKTLAEHAVTQDDIFVANMRKELRQGKVYVDYLRNDRGSTAIAPYSSRARPGAAVSMPISWEQIDDIQSAEYFTLKNAPDYLARRKADPWKNFAEARVDLHEIVQQTPEPESPKRKR